MKKELLKLLEQDARLNADQLAVMIGCTKEQVERELCEMEANTRARLEAAMKKHGLL